MNRGLAILGDTLFMGTIDAHLLAIDAKSGQLLWDTVVADASRNFSITMSPNVIKDKVIIGTAGGDMGIRGYIAAFDAKTGKEAWRFYTIPAPGEPGNDTWSGDSWREGGAAVWNAAAYDPETNLAFWGTGNPAPDWDGSVRLGDNLYSNCVVALDADTGELKWYYQFTPHDELDYDSTQVPVLADIDWRGTPRKVMLWANRNGIMYVLDRVTGEFLHGKPYVKHNWWAGFDAKGRLQRVPGMDVDARAEAVSPARARLDQLGADVVQPADGPLLRLALGELGNHRDRRPVPAAGRHQPPPDGDGADEPRAVLQQRRRSVRRDPRVRPEHARPEVGAPDGRHHLGRRACRPPATSCSAAAAKGISSRSTRAPASCCGASRSAGR